MINFLSEILTKQKRRNGGLIIAYIILFHFFQLSHAFLYLTLEEVAFEQSTKAGRESARPVNLLDLG